MWKSRRESDTGAIYTSKNVVAECRIMCYSWPSWDESSHTGLGPE